MEGTDERRSCFSHLITFSNSAIISGRTMPSTGERNVSQSSENGVNNNVTNAGTSCMKAESSSSPPPDEKNTVKVITTIPPDNSYPKSLFPFTPIRLLPMSRFADVGRAYEWQELKEKVRVSYPVKLDFPPF